MRGGIQVQAVFICGIAARGRSSAGNEGTSDVISIANLYYPLFFLAISIADRGRLTTLCASAFVFPLEYAA
jgi:hypothetical protein